MNSYKVAFKEIMRTYEADRDRAATLLRERRAEVYKCVPRVREIDERLKESGVNSAKQLLFQPVENHKALLESLREHHNELKAEKWQLLHENGVPEDYFTDIYRCNLCADTGYVQANNNNHEKTVSAERCNCLKQKIIDKYYDLSNLRGLLAEENFDTFDFRYYSDEAMQDESVSPRRNMQIIFQTSMNFVLNFGNIFQNLLFYGSTGMGKTFLCNCIAKDLLDKGRTVLYVTAPQIFKVIEDYRFHRDSLEEPNETVDAVTDVDLLILDDLGTEFDTVVTSAALFNIINQRILARKPTVVSTNLQPSELEVHYSDRIVSRFLGHYKLTEFYGEDIRAMKKYSGKVV